MSIVTVHAEFLPALRVLLQHHGLLMAGEADLRLGQGQLQGRHVALGPRHVTDGARSRHGRVHRLPADFLRVTGGTIVVLVKNAGVFDGARVHG